MILGGPSLLRSAARETNSQRTAPRDGSSALPDAFPPDLLNRHLQEPSSQRHGSADTSPQVTMNASSVNTTDDESSESLNDPSQDIPRRSSISTVATADTVFGRGEQIRQKAGACCAFDRAISATTEDDFIPPLHADESLVVKPAIIITDAQKCNDMAGGSYIAYIIHTDFRAGALHCESKHRYSEFEALRKLLTKLYPTVVVPPIPEKHTVGAYAAKPTKAKEDPRIIQRRTRMLQAFLNRVAAHPSLRGEHVFHQFLEGGVTWGDILAQSGLGHFLKRKDTSVKVSDRGALKHPDTHFALAEDYTIKFGSQISHMYKVYRSLHRQHVDMTGTYSDLGAAYNGWSLSEGPLSHAIEQVGQAVDTTVAATSQLAHNAEMGLGEPLLEYQLYSKAVDKLLRWRHKKHAEFEALSDQLIAKKASLLKLEASESEAQRLAAVLNAEGMAGHARPSSGGGGGLMATLNSLIDNDPATTRRNNISKTKDRIAALEAQRELCRVELGTANEEIQKDLDRFQMDKIKDFRNMLLSFALAQREYHRKAAKAWEEAKGEVERIQP